MVKALTSLLLLLLAFVSFGDLGLANAQPQDVVKTWCVAKPSSDESTLLANIRYACTQPRVNCSVLQEGGPCFLPDSLINHASIAMNLYYQIYGRNHWNCIFGYSALIVATDPSYGSCVYM